ncbi:histidine--tRNA ligase [bacterium (Candidatus Torokbacteria) CG_4_10_14_0_2_um_filter_35_8]|nr:MAG: histidine--tRNA ligase [bacterium (Candidatus Torokbacteria) CG_4_10_14_0_2_um_filter_35_8]
MKQNKGQKETEEKKQVLVQAPLGMNDILPAEQKYWNFAIGQMEDLAKYFGYKKIVTPIIEYQDLFTRSIGRVTDIVEKEIFEIKQKRETKLALRPEFTAGIVRSYIENGMKNRAKPVRFYSFGPIFRYSKPQKGRFREFWQFNVEALGSCSAGQDVEVILLCWDIFEKLGLKNLTLQINSIGCPNCRPEYLSLLKEYYRPYRRRLCADCKRRFSKNPLRLLDCKEARCKEVADKAPQIIDYLCPDCHSHFKSVLEFLDELDISYVLNLRLVRGLDYYTKTVFEIWPEKEGGNLSLGGGGRYDLLVEELGGDPTCACGFAIGLERIISELKNQRIDVKEERKPKVMLVQLGEIAKRKSLPLFEKLRKQGIRVLAIFGKDSVRGQLSVANKNKVTLALILGEKEALEGSIIIRDMQSGSQETVSQNRIVEEIKKRLKED